MNTFAKVIVLAASVAMCAAQMPGIGWCPDKSAMPGFDIDRYMGSWYEAERYFTVLEAGSRCARTNYTKSTDGRILVSNELINRVTGVKRALDGEIRNIPKGGVDSKITVKYSTLPIPFETTYIILDTDYDTYSVVWSCSDFGPFVNSQSAWVMTRERLPPGTTLQKAYDVLDKNKISRTFFVRADQEDCQLGEAVPSAQNTPSTYHHQYRTSINAASSHPKLATGIVGGAAPSVPATSTLSSESSPSTPAVAVPSPFVAPEPEPVKLQVPQVLEQKKEEPQLPVRVNATPSSSSVSTDAPLAIGTSPSSSSSSSSTTTTIAASSTSNDLIKPQPAITEPPKKSH